VATGSLRGGEFQPRGCGDRRGLEAKAGSGLRAARTGARGSGRLAAFGVLRRAADAGAISVFKAHGLTPAMREEIETNGDRVITSHRDIRDVVVSAMRKNGWSFRRIWREDRLRYWTRRFDEWASLPGAIVSRYDDLVSHLPQEVGRIAEHVGISLPDGADGPQEERFQGRSVPTPKIRPRACPGSSSAPPGQGRIQPDQPRLLLLMIRPARPTLPEVPLADLSFACQRR